VASPDEETGLAGENGALGQGRSADGDEGDDVGGADAGMDALLVGEIDEFGGFAGSAHGGFYDTIGCAGDGHDGTVVRFVEGPVQQANAFDVHCGDDLSDLGCVMAFGEVWNAFDDGFWIHYDSDYWLMLSV
jgi:hypothetical protein